MEELKRQPRRELLGDLKPVLESQRIQFPNIAGMMSKEECRNNFASTTATPVTIEPTDQVSGSGKPHGLEVATSRPEEVDKPTQPSLDPDTIYNLAHQIACNLGMVVEGNYRMEFGKWLVYPHQAILDVI
jgi:hypothetical protein